jgi:hypothetical protein
MKHTTLCPQTHIPYSAALAAHVCTSLIRYSSCSPRTAADAAHVCVLDTMTRSTDTWSDAAYSTVPVQARISSQLWAELGCNCHKRTKSAVCQYNLMILDSYATHDACSLRDPSTGTQNDHTHTYNATVPQRSSWGTSGEADSCPLLRHAGAATPVRHGSTAATQASTVALAFDTGKNVARHEVLLPVALTEDDARGTAGGRNTLC